MNWQSPQTVSLLLSLFGILFLLICLVLIALNRAPSLKSSERIKAFGVDMNVSVITILVFVGLALALTSTFMQVQNYEGQLTRMRDEQRVLEDEARVLKQAGRIALSAHFTLDGVTSSEKLPQLGDLYCRYYDKDQRGWVEGAKVNTGIALDYLVTLENITARTRIDRIEVVDRKTNKAWYIENVDPLSPTYKLMPLKSE